MLPGSVLRPIKERSRALLAHLHKRAAPDELALFEFDGPAKAGLIRIDGFVHVVAVKAESGLEAGGVSSPEAGR